MSEHYILDGHTPVPVDLTTWAKWFETNRDKKRVDSTVKDGVRVSTVFLGLNHAYTPTEPPLIFGSMIFGGEHDQYQDRCSTWDQAVAMHKKACAIAFGGAPND